MIRRNQIKNAQLIIKGKTRLKRKGLSKNLVNCINRYGKFSDFTSDNAHLKIWCNIDYDKNRLAISISINKQSSDTIFLENTLTKLRHEYAHHANAPNPYMQINTSSKQFTYRCYSEGGRPMHRLPRREIF